MEPKQQEEEGGPRPERLIAAAAVVSTDLLFIYRPIGRPSLPASITGQQDAGGQSGTGEKGRKGRKKTRRVERPGQEPDR